PYLDAIILSKLAPAVVVGWFGAARNVLGTLLAPAAILGAAAYPHIARASTGLIYGAEGFGAAATILRVFSPALFLIFIDILLGNIIYASGGGTGFAVAKIVSVVVGTALDLVLIPMFQA